jgi:hypothetical protein
MTKICNLITSWPAGTIGVQARFEKLQIYKQLSNKYVASGWLKKIGVGAYVRAGEDPTWQGGMYAMQQDLNLKLHVGGLSALELLNRSHFIPMGIHTRLYIFSHGKHMPRYLPKWFLDLENLTVNYLAKNLFKSEIGIMDFNCGNFKIQISEPERALLEILSLVPKKSSFEHACLLMQYQNGLRVDLLRHLLQECNSLVAKRLFLHLSRRFSLDFMRHLNLKGIDLGRGVKSVSQGEIFDKEFNIYVPKISDDLNPDQEVPNV